MGVVKCPDFNFQKVGNSELTFAVLSCIKSGRGIYFAPAKQTQSAVFFCTDTAAMATKSPGVLFFFFFFFGAVVGGTMKGFMYLSKYELLTSCDLLWEKDQ